MLRVDQLLEFFSDTTKKTLNTSNSAQVLFVFLLAILVRLIYLLIIPFGQTPDEIYFFERSWSQLLSWTDSDLLVNHLKAFPNNEYFYPPLYFWLSAAFLKLWVPLGLISESWRVAFFEYDLYLRFLMFSFSLVLLCIVWSVFKKIDLQFSIKFSVFIFIALLPSFASFTIAPNPNTLLFFLIALFVYFMFNHQWLEGENNIRILFKLGLIAGLSILTKFEGFFLLVILPPSFFFLRMKRKLFFQVGLVWLIALLVGGWWYLVNILQSGWFYDRELFQVSIAENIVPFSFDHYIEHLSRDSLDTFFVAFGAKNNIRLTQLAYFVLKVVTIVGIFGFFEGKFLKTINNSRNLKSIFYTLGFLMLLNFIVFLALNLQFTFQAQGRYLFPSIFFTAMVLVMGISNWFGKNYLKLLPWSVLGFLLFFNFWGMGCLIMAYFGEDVLPFFTRCVIS